MLTGQVPVSWRKPVMLAQHAAKRRNCGGPREGTAAQDTREDGAQQPAVLPQALTGWCFGDCACLRFEGRERVVVDLLLQGVPKIDQIDQIESGDHGVRLGATIVF